MGLHSDVFCGAHSDISVWTEDKITSGFYDAVLGSCNL